jgi:hypothetical protein
MNKIINKRIALSIGALSVFALALVAVPSTTHAQFDSPYGSYGYGPQVINTPVYVRTPVQVPVYTPVNVPVYRQTVVPVNSTQNTPAPADDNSNLAANAIFGSNSFLPSGIIQWILFAILILVIVIIARKIFGADKKYHETPLKHA